LIAERESNIFLDELDKNIFKILLSKNYVLIFFYLDEATGTGPSPRAAHAAAAVEVN